MTELVTDCPRCRSNTITFDIKSAIILYERHGWQLWYEAFCIYRHCSRSTVFVLADSVDGDHNYLHSKGLLNLAEAANQYVRAEGYISTKDTLAVEAPDHTPEKIKAIFREGATCLSVNCFNAAGTMFRLCVDLATIGLLPEKDENGLNARIRRNLGLRLPWMFDNGILPEALRSLAGCVREDGNDAAHAGTLTREDATDLLDFSSVLLERLYTEPERLRLAEERREARRKEE